MLEVANIIVAVVGVLVAVVAAILSYRQGQRNERNRILRIADHNWTEERNYDYERLLRELVGLDYAAIPGLDQQTEGVPSQWAPIFEKSKQTWRLVVNPEGMVVAYWAFFFPTDTAVHQMRVGEFFEGHLRADDILEPTPGTARPIFLSMLAVHPVFEGDTDILSLLYKSMADAADELDDDGIQITEVYSNAFSTKGINISRKLGLKQGITDARGNTLFVGQWGKDLREKLTKRSQLFAMRSKQPALGAT